MTRHTEKIGAKTQAKYPQRKALCGHALQVHEIRHIIFDLDGTLVEPSHLDQAFLQVALSAGAEGGTVSEVLQYRFRGQHHLTSFSEALPEHDEDELLLLVEQMWNTIGNNPGSPLRGAARALAAAERHQCNLFLSTGSAPALMTQTLHVHGWENLFLLACGSSPDFDKGEHHLPAVADHLELPLEEFAAHTLTVGDGATEMRHGKALGMPYRVGLIDPEREYMRKQLTDAGANLIIEDIGMLEDILDHPTPLNVSAWRP
jgi:phosphoglycolate phosphatase-like HAD superfamily hydrolase